MVKLCKVILAAAIAAGAAAAQNPAAAPQSAPPVKLLSGLGSLHHPVTTGNAGAQAFFDQGLTLVYAFNHPEAVRMFRRAAEIDPKLAMAYWGVALALGPNINSEVTPEREKEAYAAIQKARRLDPDASQPERDYIEALATRYSDDPHADYKKLALDYNQAMRELVKKYPDDLDAATLFAESGMDLDPWKFWRADGTPAPGTLEIVDTLESVLRRDPNHIGANHYYIHSVEASPHPERALASAERLPRLAPGAGHLVHMPAHIYFRLGDYAAASRANEQAAETDRRYIEMTGVHDEYTTMYYSHDLHFLAISCSMEGRPACAEEAARRLEENLAPAEKTMPEVSDLMATRFEVAVRFHQWKEILDSPAPGFTAPVASGVWHFARGMALAATGKPDEAESEEKKLGELRQAMTPDTPSIMMSPGGVLEIADDLLRGKIALERHDTQAAIAALEASARAEDALPYDEPPEWCIPARESLGGLYLREKNYAAAEQVFRADLRKNPLSGRSLFGLLQSLRGQGKTYDAGWVEKEFLRAWQNADITLRVEDL